MHRTQRCASRTRANVSLRHPPFNYSDLGCFSVPDSGRFSERSHPEEWVWTDFTRLSAHTPSTAGTFRRKFRKNSGKTPETLLELFLQFPSRVWPGSPKPYNSRHKPESPLSWQFSVLFYSQERLLSSMTVSEYCLACVFPSFVFQRSKQQNRIARTTSSTILLSPSEPYSHKESPNRSASSQLPCWLGSQVGIHRKLALSQLGTAHKTVLGHLLI